MTSALPNIAHTVSVGLGLRSYDILIGNGLLAHVPDLIQPLLKRQKVVIVTDHGVAAHHLPVLKDACEKAGLETHTVDMPSGEGSKSFSMLEALLDNLIALDVDRSDLILALGGGVVGDITGFAASILRRGCRFVQIPTTLLAQVDSSVGGKTAVNAKAGKNLIGAFHQPSMVIADIETLDTLPPRQLRAGYAEVVKYGLIDDPAFFNWLAENGQALLEGDQALRAEAVRHSCAAKARIVEEDETETGRRALLNLGHTFGHAFEAATGYSDKLFHGEAVALGMGLAHDYCAENGLCPASDAATVRHHLQAVGLPATVSDLNNLSGLETDAQFLMEAIAQDKKVSGGKLTFILTKGLGKAYIAKDVDPAPVQAFLTRHLAAAT